MHIPAQTRTPRMIRVPYRNQPEAPWIGELVLDLRNGRNWAAGTADLSIRRDTIVVRLMGRELAVMDRDRLREWLTTPEPDPLAVDDAIWMAELGMTYLSAGQGLFRITTESLALLITVI